MVAETETVRTGDGAENPVVAIVAGTSWYIWNFRRNVVRAFASAGWDVVLIAPKDESTRRLAEIPGTRFLDWTVSLDGSDLASEAASLRQVVRHLRSAQPDLVLNNGIKANVYSGLGCRVLGLSYVNNVSGLGRRMARPGIGARALARLYAFASSGGRGLMIQNRDDLEFLYTRGLSRRIPIHQTMGSGVDLEHFAQAPMPPARARHFVFVGRLQDDKGIRDFVEAAKVLQSRVPGSAFTVVGDLRHTNAGGIPEAELERWKVLGFVEFAGRQEDVRPWLKKAHVLVMPSHGGEGMPKVILEAAAIGRPVIASDTPGCRDAIQPGVTGWLHRPSDVSSLAAVMQDVAEMPAEELERMGRAARDRAERLYSDEAVSRLCLELGNASRRR